MKTLFAIIALTLAGTTAFSQEPAVSPTPTPKTADAPAPAVTPESVSKIVEPISPCDLTVQHSPIIMGGLKLRMPEAEAALKLNAKFENDPAMSANGKRLNASLGSNPIFEKADSATATSVGQKVSYIRLKLIEPRFATAKEFVSAFAPKLGLIRNAFRLDEEKKEAKIVCKDFTVELKTNDTGSEIILVDTAPPGSSSARIQ
jgi:hypothetical protein